MKKISVFILLIAATLTSCSKDDDGGSDENGGSEISESNLVGKWLLTGITRDGKAVELDECDLKTSYEFKSDKTSIFVETGIIGEGTNEEVCREWAYPAKWSLSNSTLTIIYDDENEALEIIELSNTTLIFDDSDNDSEDSSFSTFEKM
ncbi:lipocalin family protein [Aquimarina sp. W85]|uniref:lipocalin family protein n=1 Tax=Aquimarina rhodophyticola TaxID=3342246 RepID=UPI003670CF85